MKNSQFKLIAIGYLLTAICFSALAQGTTFTYQGRLTDTGGPANGAYDLTFSIFAASSGGSAVDAAFHFIAIGPR